MIRYVKIKKRKVHPLYRHWGSAQAVRPIGGVEVHLHSFMTTALEGSEGLDSRPGLSFSPVKTRYPLYRRMGGPQGRVGQVRKISPPPRFDPRTVQPAASRYTGWAIPALFRVVIIFLDLFCAAPGLGAQKGLLLLPGDVKHLSEQQVLN